MTKTQQPIALITGASQGVGKAVAEGLLAAGFYTFLVARRLEPLETIASAWPGQATAIAGDVSQPESVEQVYQTVRDTAGRLDLLFNNAGAFMASTEVADVSWEDWRRVLDVNLDGAFLMARGAFQLMRAQTPRGGRIINNGSISAHAPRVGSVAYTTSKHAITGLTKSLSLDGRAHNIACGQIDIGNADTPLTAGIKNGIAQPDGSLRKEPVMDVAHVAEAVRYMAELPLEANVQFMTVMATQMPYLGRG